MDEAQPTFRINDVRFTKSWDLSIERTDDLCMFLKSERTSEEIIDHTCVRVVDGEKEARMSWPEFFERIFRV